VSWMMGFYFQDWSTGRHALSFSCFTLWIWGCFV
jgi:hypothetical protein